MEVAEQTGEGWGWELHDLPTASSPNKTVSQALQCRTGATWLVSPHAPASIYSPEVKLMMCKIIRNNENHVSTLIHYETYQHDTYISQLVIP